MGVRGILKSPVEMVNTYLFARWNNFITIDLQKTNTKVNLSTFWEVDKIKHKAREENIILGQIPYWVERFINWTRIGGLGIFQQHLNCGCKQVQLEKPVFLEFTYFVHSCFFVSWLVVYSCFIAKPAYVVNNNNQLYVIYASGYLAYKLIGNRTKTNAEIKCLRL